jgi:aminoglycoside phosphotransferase (APT) family kinase protein
MSHRVEREYQVLLALQDTDVPVPRVYAFCDDVSVIGTMFYLMEYLEGRIFEDTTMPHVTAEERTVMWRDAIQTLAKIHAVDLSEAGLEGFGKARGYYDRQIKTWTTICASQEKVIDVETNEPVGRLPYFEDCVRCFRNERLQPRERVSLIHGDYKIDNLVFHPTEPRVIGVLE